ncbi:MAG TPA: hypothetical protein VMZ71_16065 [Gemmataceae bacterium]|nr:hypothetical protein [Gemmataceae bacterium]
MTTRDQWLARLAKLNIDRSRGPAPHKPLLLLAVLARMDEGEALPAVLSLTPELAFRFQTLWAVVAHPPATRARRRWPWCGCTSRGDGHYGACSGTTTAST